MKKTYFVILLALLPLIMLAKMPSSGLSLFPAGAQSMHQDTAFPLLDIVGRLYDVGNHWKDIEKQSYIYDEQGSFHANRVVEHLMNYDIPDWEAENIHEITYNEDMKVIEVLSGVPTAIGIDPESRFDVGYDDNGNLSYAHNYVKNDSGEMVPALLFDFVFDHDGFFGTNLTMYFGDMIIYAQIEMGLDDEGRLISETTSVSLDQENWEVQDKTEYIYHPEDNTTFQDVLDHFNQNWPLGYVTGFSELPGMYITRTDYNYSDGGWIPKKKFEYSYSEGKRTQSIEYQYENGDWDAQNKNLYGYNDLADLKYQLHQQMNDSGVFVDHYKYDYIYANEVSNEDDAYSPVADVVLSLWPMPFNEMLNIHIESKEPQGVSLEVYNLKGQLIDKPSTMGQNRITWDGKDARGKELPNGVYFLRAVSGKNAVIKKMIKLK